MSILILNTGLTEEQIIHTFSSVGQVLSFRLVYDNDTGRPKGFGFAEFADTDAAASAVRNLNNFEVMGRELRVDFSHVGGKEDTAPAGYNAQLPPQTQAPPPAQIAQASNGYNQSSTASSNLPPLPPGVDLPPGLTCPNAISQTLTTLPAPQLLDILSQMKALVVADPAKATELLKQAPQLSYAIFQALLLMGLVDTTVLASVVDQASQPAQPPPQQPPPSRPTPVYQAPPPSQPVYQQYPATPAQHVSIPSAQPMPYQQPQPAQHPPPSQQPGQEELLKQVLAMPQQQIDLLPPTERSQIMMLRQQYIGRY